ncbi:hypothetical protein EXIGLDRAFT_847726 [Exidia glandulosa HHB12029]|uniref:Hydrophobin n=1 Tax=Exidia glandulosa HHB12029 TaxID=1314781 RepID=A0A165Z050_EXIGL|nr:hypothetical protein EXIGLDRAFT_847726 [Exidia glandulosa HHB12029]
MRASQFLIALIPAALAQVGQPQCEPGTGDLYCCNQLEAGQSPEYGYFLAHYWDTKAPLECKTYPSLGCTVNANTCCGRGREDGYICQPAPNTLG